MGAAFPEIIAKQKEVISIVFIFHLVRKGSEVLERVNIFGWYCERRD